MIPSPKRSMMEMTNISRTVLAAMCLRACFQTVSKPEVGLVEGVTGMCAAKVLTRNHSNKYIILLPSAKRECGVVCTYVLKRVL